MKVNNINITRPSDVLVADGRVYSVRDLLGEGEITVQKVAAPFIANGRVYNIAEIEGGDTPEQEQPEYPSAPYTFAIKHSDLPVMEVSNIYPYPDDGNHFSDYFTLDPLDEYICDNILNGDTSYTIWINGEYAGYLSGTDPWGANAITEYDEYGNFYQTGIRRFGVCFILPYAKPNNPTQEPEVSIPNIELYNMDNRYNITVNVQHDSGNKFISHLMGIPAGTYHINVDGYYEVYDRSIVIRGENDFDVVGMMGELLTPYAYVRDGMGDTLYEIHFVY